MANGVTVIVVPGFLASGLRTGARAYGWIPGEVVWLNYIVIAQGGWRYLTLDNTGEHTTYPWVGDLQGEAPLQAYYQDLFNYLTVQNYNGSVSVNDWRRAMVFDATNLANQIRAAAGAAPVNIVCHSRGGLVTRVALHLLLQSGDIGLIGRVAGLGVPHQGTLLATMTLAGFGEPLLLINNLINTIAKLPQPLLIPNELLATFRSFPGLYELQPSPGSSWMNQGDASTVNDAAAWAAIAPPISNEWLDAAVTNWETFPAVPAGVPWLDVIGTGFVTPQGLVASAVPLEPSGMSYSGQGDGVVMYQSARLGIGPQILTPTGHSALPKDGRIFPYLDQWFLGRLNHDIVIEGPPIM